MGLSTEHEDNETSASPTAPRAQSAMGPANSTYRAGDNLQKLGKWAVDLQHLPRDGQINISDWLRSAKVVASLARAEENAALDAGDIELQWMAPAAYQCTAHELNHAVKTSSSPAAAYSHDAGTRAFPYGRSLTDWEACDSNVNTAHRRQHAHNPLQPRAHTLSGTSGFNRTMHYARIAHGVPWAPPQAWIGEGLPLFDANAPRLEGAPLLPAEAYPSPAQRGRDPAAPASLFVVDPVNQRGVHCRLGQRGIIAACHYDAVRNFIAVISGRKRYIMARPDQCSKLNLVMEGPSVRHSGSDWRTPEGIARVGDALAFEVVLEAGDVLYVPAFWFHFIVNLSTNTQCNTRSGTPPSRYIEDLLKCGFDMRDTPTEKEGQFTVRGTT